MRVVGKTIWKAVCVFLSVFLLAGTAATLAGTVYLESYVAAAEGKTLAGYRFCGRPAELYAYDPSTRAARGDDVHRLADEVIPQSRSVFVPYEEFPRHLVNAFVAIEDKRFFSHAGVDLRRTVSAGVRYLTRQGHSFGGSTITQQLVKNLTGRDEYTPARKFAEIFEAMELEKNADKTQILEAYLNIINLAGGCRGVGAAAVYYFDKRVSDLTLAECACLAAITNNPARYDPRQHPENNRARRELILAQMEAQGYIGERERLQAVTAGVTLCPLPDEHERISSWYTDMVISDVLRDLQERLGYSAAQAALMVYAGGLKIYTAVDESLQAIVEEAYADLSNFPQGEKGRPQSSMMIIDIHTGDILAVAGAVGRKSGRRLQNYATDTCRPAGSAIKPLSVYAPAVERGLITWADVREDQPMSREGGRPWPRNADGVYRGRVSVAYALAHSLNTVPVRLLDEVGMEASFSFLHDALHMRSLRPAGEGKVNDMTVASLALGQQSHGVTVRELTAAYTVFDQGVYHAPVSYHKVIDADGRVLLENRPGGEVVLSRETAGLMTQMLREVVTSGTARALTFSEVTGVQVAGKTGTTQNNCDRWFIGYTPRLVCGVWMGYDYPTPVESQGNPCLPLWDKIMCACERTYTGAPTRAEFPLPSGLFKVSYCTLTGGLPTARCRAEGRQETGWFVRGRCPDGLCPGHEAATPEADPTDEAVE